MTTDTVGGVWTFTQELASGLLEQGCEVALFSLGRAPGSEQHAWYSEMEACWGSSFSFLSADTPLEWMEENDRALTESSPLLLRLADEFQPDLLHCNQFCFGALPVAIPRIVTAHSDVLSWAASCDVLLENSTWLSHYQSLVRTGLGEADAVVAPTRWMLHALGANFALPERQLIIPNGRTIAAVPQRPRKLQSVTAGRLWDLAKNIATLLNVNSPLPILFAGETSCEQASAPAVAGKATALGALSQQALLALFRESAIYTCTSQYEPFGLAPLEAALCGCAVLANDIPPLREVWGEGALYFGDAGTLSQLLQALSYDPEFLADQQARSFACAQRYTREAMARAYRSLFEDLVARKRKLYVA